MDYFFHFSSLYPAPYIELYMCLSVVIRDEFELWRFRVEPSWGTPIFELNPSWHYWQYVCQKIAKFKLIFVYTEN